MGDYKLYFLNQSGQIVVRVDLDCTTDEEAIIAAQVACDGREMELWDLGRHVMRFPRGAHPAA